MVVAFDTTALAACLHPDASRRIPATDASERLGGLVREITEQRGTIVVPTPALSEFLALAAGGRDRYLSEVEMRTVFEIQPFDLAAAVEAAAATRAALARGDKRPGARGPWQKVKVDRQIVAVAAVHGAEVIYSDDADIRVLGKDSGIPVVTTGELPLPRRGLFES